MHDIPCPQEAFSAECLSASYIDEAIRQFGELILTAFARYSDENNQFFLIRRAGELGFVSYSFGTCAHCDTWMACESDSSRRELIAEVWRSIRWYPTLAELQTEVSSPEIELHHFAHESGFSEFKQAVLALRA